jgi:hypothetical protein
MRIIEVLDGGISDVMMLGQRLNIALLQSRM